MFYEEEAYLLENDYWVGYNATQDADHFVTKLIYWVECPICGQGFNPENPYRACIHFVNYCGSTVIFSDDIEWEEI